MAFAIPNIPRPRKKRGPTIPTATPQRVAARPRQGAFSGVKELERHNRGRRKALTGR